MRFLAFVAILALISPCVRAITFYEVPGNCQRLLEELPAGEVAEVVDWRSWAPHLRDLGYAEPVVIRITQANYWTFSVPDALWNLTSWPSLRGVDVGERMDRFLDRKSARALLISHSSLKILMQRIPFWLDPRDPRGQVTRILGLADDRDVALAYLAMESRLESPAKERLREALVNRTTSALRTRRFMVDQPLLQHLSVVPWAEIVPVVRDVLARNWVDLERDPPWQTSRVQAGGFGLVKAENCKHMSQGHLRALGLAPHAHRGHKARFLRVDGRVVGALKEWPFGERSMVALRNVTDERGRVVLAIGAVYRVSWEVWNTEPEGDFVDVESLRAGPIDFLLNHFAWEAEAVPHLLRLVMSPVEAQAVVDEYEAKNEGLADFMPWSNARDEYHRTVQPALVRRLVRIRKEMETR